VQEWEAYNVSRASGNVLFVRGRPESSVTPMLTSDQVLALFKKWRDSAVPLQVDCFFRGGARPANLRVQIKGVVRVVDEPTIVVSSQDGNSVEMCLRDCQFKSGEKVVADAPKELRVEFGLTEMVEIDFSSGETCIVTTYRTVN
jgi:hypothetical protein